jgi:hypothetical protein
MHFKKIIGGGCSIVALYTLICGAIYLLELSPITGTILLGVMGPLWIGIAVHVMMAHLAVSALARSIAIAWILAPLTYYAGGLALHFESLRETEALAAQIEMTNESQRKAVELPFVYQAAGVESLPLLELYRSAAAFAVAGQQGGKREYLKYYYAKGDECSAAPESRDLGKRFEPSVYRRQLFSNPSDDGTRRCLLERTVLENPATYEIRQWIDNTAPNTLLLQARLNIWTVKDTSANKAIVSVKFGSIAALPLVQTIFAGCTPSVSGPSRVCSQSLVKSSGLTWIGFPNSSDERQPSAGLDPRTGSIALLARALDLTPRHPTD